MSPGCQETRGTGSTQHQSTHRICFTVYVMCNNLLYPCVVIVNCVLLCLPVSGEKNHMAVKIHLHSSSGVREVVSGTLMNVDFTLLRVWNYKVEQSFEYESEAQVQFFCKHFQ
jgi:hypothetical protein